MRVQADRLSIFPSSTNHAAAEANKSGRASTSAANFENLCSDGGLWSIACPTLATLWTEGRQRCSEAGISDEVWFATKSERATATIGGVVEAGMPSPWATGYKAYGQVGALRRAVVGHGLSYVFAALSNESVGLAEQRRASSRGSTP